MDVNGACRPSLIKNVFRKFAMPNVVKERRLIRPMKLDVGYNVFTKFIVKTTLADEYRSMLLDICEQELPISFGDMFPKNRYNVRRFDSGTYADVYKANVRGTREVLVLKIVRAVSKDVQKRLPDVSFGGTETFDDVYNEVLISKTLTDLHYKNGDYLAHSFPKICDVKLVEGLIPDYFLYSTEPENVKLPERSEPYARYTGAPIEYVVLVMKFGGEPIWKMIKERRVNAYQLLSIAKQVTFALAVAEKQYKYEHRDMHISNVLVKPTNKEYIEFIVDGSVYHVETVGYRAYIIDHTFSRLTVEDTVVYKDMADILKDRDEKPTLQNAVYKWMLEVTQNEWQRSCPKTNVFWLHYLFQTLQKSSLVRDFPNTDIKNAFTEYSKVALRCKHSNQLLDFIVEKSCRDEL